MSTVAQYLEEKAKRQLQEFEKDTLDRSLHQLDRQLAQNSENLARLARSLASLANARGLKLHAEYLSVVEALQRGSNALAMLRRRGW